MGPWAWLWYEEKAPEGAQPHVESLYSEDFPRAQGAYTQLLGFLEEKFILSLLQQAHRCLESHSCLCPSFAMAAQTPDCQVLTTINT